MPDSYDMLARSIERVIRSDLPLPASQQQLTDAIDHIMTEESRAGELRLAYLRVLVVAAFAVLSADALVRHDPGDPFAPTAAAAALTMVLSAAWLAFAVGLALALRQGWYQRGVPHVMPGVDAVMIAAGFLLPLYFGGRFGAGASPEALAGLTVLCAFLSIAGGLRLSRSSSRIGTGLAVAIFVVAAASAGLALLPAFAVVVTLVGTGLLSAGGTELVRRLVTDEAAKATLARMYKEAALAIEAREEVLKIVSHDLRNPLGTIDMGAALLLEVEVARPVQVETLQRIRRAGKRMDRLVNDLLDVAKLEAGRVAITPRPLDVVALLDDAHDQLEPLASKQSIALEVDAAGGLPPVSADEERVQQVISNLVGNSLKFTPAGGRIVLRARAVADGVQVSVIDTGKGIAADQLERIFSRFWQANAADRRGIGLGLTIAKRIMDAHGARMWVESRVGEGTGFHFVLGHHAPASMPGSRDRRERTLSQSAGPV